MTLFDRIETELAAMPGVTAAASANILFVGNDGGGNSVDVEGFEAGPGIDTTVARSEVSSSFFHTFSIPLLAGRNFTGGDTLSTPKVAIVNQSFVRKFNLGDHAVGTRFSGFPYDNIIKVDLEIVGVVADAAYAQVKDAIQPQYFQPRRQSDKPDSMVFYVSAPNPDALIRRIPDVVSRIDKNLPVNNLIRMRRQVQDNVYLDRLVAALSGAFAVLATLLAAIGLYGTLSYNVALRTRELGLRLALGAQPASLRRMVLRQVAVMAIMGGGIGLTAAMALRHSADACCSACVDMTCRS
jgi:ABC-type antimicrobial peptide transport system permease subunit